jgi:hypothetical protein
MRALVITAIAAVVAGLGVAALLVVNTNQPRRISAADYVPFRAGPAVTLEREIKTAPVFFPDPRRGTRAFFIDSVDGSITALHVLVPGRPKCATRYDRKQRRYFDCDNHTIDPHRLERFPVTITGSGDARVVDVDLRRVLPPLRATEPTP